MGVLKIKLKSIRFVPEPKIQPVRITFKYQSRLPENLLDKVYLTYEELNGRCEGEFINGTIPKEAFLSGNIPIKGLEIKGESGQKEITQKLSSETFGYFFKYKKVVCKNCGAKSRHNTTITRCLLCQTIIRPKKLETIEQALIRLNDIKKPLIKN